MILTEYFRKNALRRQRSSIPTTILPLGKVSSAIAFIDVEDPSFNECKNSLMNFFRENKIKGEIFFFDLRRIGKGERLITSVTNTILKRDLNWYGRPSSEKLAWLDSFQEVDMLISLLPDSSFLSIFTAGYCKARCKVGRVQLRGGIFDIVVADPSGRTLSEAESFEAMKTILKKIQ